MAIMLKHSTCVLTNFMPFLKIYQNQMKYTNASKLEHVMPCMHLNSFKLLQTSQRIDITDMLKVTSSHSRLDYVYVILI
jgi:hypothetical protein